MARLALLRIDAPPAVLLRLPQAFPERYPVLFDSVSGGPLAGHSVLVCATDEALWIDHAGQLQARGAGPEALLAGAAAAAPPRFLATLDAWWRQLAERHSGPLAAGTGPFAGGFAVFLGYETAAELEPRLRGRLPDPAESLRAFALRTPSALVLDQRDGSLRAVTEEGPDAALRLQQMASDVAAVRADAGAGSALAAEPVYPAWEEDDPGEFLARVLEAQERIRDGDVYQVNLSRGWSARFEAAAQSNGLAPLLYQRLRAANPAPFAVWSRWGGMEILSSSPERLIRIDRDGGASTRPIAGTRPRDPQRDPERDAALARELIANAKERAEHVMLIDLERNDLGRVCEAGSVRVSEFMCVESYSHVHHIVSQVEGQLRPDVSPVAALAAVFPGGTITGCPKLRCMEIIAGLETIGRGPYTGSIGLLGIDGSADFNILIRTLSLCDGVLRLRAGAGIVADSVPERELEETRAKARGVLAALRPGAQ